MSAIFTRLLIVAVTVAGGIWAAWELGASPAGAVSENVRAGGGDRITELVFPVRVATVRRGPLVRDVNVAGTLRPVRSYPVAFQVPGVLVRHALWNGHVALGHNARVRVEREDQ